MKYKVIGDCDVADVPPGGVVTDEQLAAHRAQGLSMKKRFVYQDWCTLVLEK